MNQSISVGQTASFSCATKGAATLNFQWQRNQIDITNAKSSTYTTPATVLTDTGAKFRCVVTNAFGTAISNEATLTVTAPPPVLAIEENTIDSAVPLESSIFTVWSDCFLSVTLRGQASNKVRVRIQ